MFSHSARRVTLHEKTNRSQNATLTTHDPVTKVSATPQKSIPRASRRDGGRCDSVHCENNAPDPMLLNKESSPLPLATTSPDSRQTAPDVAAKGAGTNSPANEGVDGAAAGARVNFINSVATLRALNKRDLERVDAAILDSLRSSADMIPEVGGRLVTAGGKRLRPMLTLSAAAMFDCDGDSHILLAAAVELIHGATLLHDDVVDASALRRGVATANVVWGNKESVLVGDFIFSRAFELMVAADNISVLRILSRAAGVIAEGEVLQLGTQKNIDSTFEMYLQVVDAKTAALFAAAAEAGAIISGASAEEATALRAFGRNLGLAYQLIDDALDYSGREAALGKTVGDDFREGKMTLPVVYALRRADDAERDFWRRTIGEGRQSSEDFTRASEIIASRGALDETAETARDFARTALQNLDAAPAGAHRDALAALAAASVDRAF